MMGYRVPAGPADRFRDAVDIVIHKVKRPVGAWFGDPDGSILQHNLGLVRVLDRAEDSQQLSLLQVLAVAVLLGEGVVVVSPDQNNIVVSKVALDPKYTRKSFC